MSRQYHILTRDDRLETVARDIVRHFLGRGFVGKAMVVSIDKATALKMHDKVRKHWVAERERVEREIARIAKYPLGRRSQTAATEEDAVAALYERRVSIRRDFKSFSAAGDPRDHRHGADRFPGRKRDEQMKRLGSTFSRTGTDESAPPLDEQFKDPQPTLRLVFVCAMWMTGFDAPSCSAVYLDRPMRNHTLMQTIARANRVFPDKDSGVIVDYAGVFACWRRRLPSTGPARVASGPFRNKQELAEDLRRAVDAATAFCAQNQVILPAIEQLPAGNFERLQRIDDAVNALISPDALRREFFGHERIVNTLYIAVKPDPVALEFAGRVACVAAIAGAIRMKINPHPVDISGVMGMVGELLDSSITGVDMPAKPAGVMDLSKIDFEALSKRFKQSPHKNTDLEVLKAVIRAQSRS